MNRNRAFFVILSNPVVFSMTPSYLEDGLNKEGVKRPVSVVRSAPLAVVGPAGLLGDVQGVASSL